MRDTWPNIPYAQWRETCGALHLYAQIVGKYRLARTPWINHSWHATFYVNGRGLTTGPVPEAGRTVEVQFDLVAHQVEGRSSDGRSAAFALEPMSVALFHARFLALLEGVGATAKLNGRPSEVADGVPFKEDHEPRPYDAEAVARYFQALSLIAPVLDRFRTGFIGKSSPVHLFWGSFDLNVARFSGRPAPPHPGGVPGLPDEVMREAESHENFSAGFWPGGGLAGIEYPAFYAYAYPASEGLDQARVQPAQAFYAEDLGEFLLPYDAVRQADDPAQTLLDFLDSTYSPAADLGKWDRDALDCVPGEPLRPRPVAK